MRLVEGAPILIWTFIFLVEFVPHILGKGCYWALTGPALQLTPCGALRTGMEDKESTVSPIQPRVKWNLIFEVGECSV